MPVGKSNSVVYIKWYETHILGLTRAAEKHVEGKQVCKGNLCNCVKTYVVLKYIADKHLDKGKPCSLEASW